jgi:hypothetical protein
MAILFPISTNSAVGSKLEQAATIIQEAVEDALVIKRNDSPDDIIADVGAFTLLLLAVELIRNQIQESQLLAQLQEPLQRRRTVDSGPDSRV